MPKLTQPVAAKRSSGKKGDVRDLKGSKIDAVEEAMMALVDDAVGEDARFADFEEMLLEMSSEVARRVSKKKSSG